MPSLVLALIVPDAAGTVKVERTAKAPAPPRRRRAVGNGTLPDLGPDGDADGEADAGEDVVPESEADGGTEAGADAGDGGLVPCAGGWYDPSSGLCWQDPAL